jgi:hypothetical protein
MFIVSKLSKSHKARCEGPSGSRVPMSQNSCIGTAAGNRIPSLQFIIGRQGIDRSYLTNTTTPNEDLEGFSVFGSIPDTINIPLGFPALYLHHVMTPGGSLVEISDASSVRT